MTEEKRLLSSCLTDKPVDSVEEDNLRAEDYANALAKFIRNAATPVTIGIQGGWGSGKTSLITVLEHKLDEDPIHPTLCVAVNAWEHSLFQTQDMRSEVALSLLSALNEGLAESVKAAPWLDKSAASFIVQSGEMVEKTIGNIKVGLLYFGKVMTQMAANMVGGGDISNVKVDGAGNGMAGVPKMAASVRKLRSTLTEMIDKITYGGKPVKIVFFIDDLDRVPPKTAVEILDITKNIFEIPQCVFVLAIDYEVVVKGLEDKFGPKNRENEREFRQYFDKIIQIPFTMPIGAYGENLSEMLKSSLGDLGYLSAEKDKKILAKLAGDAKLATGGIPRGIKRILNMLSLLQHIADARYRKGAGQARVGLPSDIEARFIIVALHVNFPEISRRLMERPNFTQWQPVELDAPWGLKLHENRPELNFLEKDHLFDDPWEQVVYCLCANSPWLKTMSRSLSRLMNNLLVALGGDENNATTMPDEGLAKLRGILKSISVVSIDSSPESAASFDTKNMKDHAVTKFFARLRDEMAQKMPENFPRHGDEEATFENNLYSCVVNLEGGEGGYPKPYFQLDWDPDENRLWLYIYGGKPGSRAFAKPILQEARGSYATEFDGGNFYFFFDQPFNKNEIAAQAKIGELADEVVKLWETVDAAQKKLWEAYKKR